MESNFQESQFVVLFPWKVILHWQDDRVERVNFVFLKGLLTKKITYLKLFKCCHFRTKSKRYSKRIYIANMPSQFKLKITENRNHLLNPPCLFLGAVTKWYPDPNAKADRNALQIFKIRFGEGFKLFSSTIVLLHRPGSRERHLTVVFANQFSILLKIQALPGEVVVVWHKSHARLSFDYRCKNLMNKDLLMTMHCHFAM